MNTQKLAEILVASWTVAEGAGKAIPTGPGLLDKALQKVVAENFTDEFRSLRFVKTRVGTRCAELREIFSWALAEHLISDPNPSYTYTTTNLSAAAAFQILDEFGIKTQDAAKWGQALASAVRAQLQEEGQRDTI